MKVGQKAGAANVRQSLIYIRVNDADKKRSPI